MKNLRAIYIIWYRDILRFWRDRMRMIGAFAFPLLFLAVFGAGLSSSLGMLAPGVDYVQFMFPGIIGMIVLMTSLMSGLSIVWVREFGFLREVLVAPISRGAVAIGKILGGATIAMIQGTILLVLAPLIGVSLSALTVFELLGIMLLLAISLAALGILIASRLRSMEAFQGIMQLLVFPMIFLSGAFFPLTGLPSWLSALVKVNIATHGIDPLRQALLGPSDVSTLGITLFGHTMSITDDLLVVAAFGLVMVGLAMWSFGRQE